MDGTLLEEELTDGTEPVMEKKGLISSRLNIQANIFSFGSGGTSTGQIVLLGS